MRFSLFSILALSGLLWVAPASAAPNVVVSIKPIHSLVSAVMQGVGVPHLIVRGGASPHTFSLRPSDAEALANADLVFWIGPDLENFLVGPIDNLAREALSIAISEQAAISLLGLRLGLYFESEGHDDEGAEEHSAVDMHLWLDPTNAIAIVETAATTLAAADTENADLYHANADAFVGRLQDLQTEVSARLAPFHLTPFVTFHDGYQYFERRFGVEAAGAITLNPESQPGVRRITEARETIVLLGAVCVFSEPQFEPSLVTTVTEGTNARTGTLDPIGADLEDGPELYFQLIRQLADNMQACLSG